jgi:hypothetical protein
MVIAGYGHHGLWSLRVMVITGYDHCGLWSSQVMVIVGPMEGYQKRDKSISQNLFVTLS